jgi:hypothetical protein
MLLLLRRLQSRRYCCCLQNAPQNTPKASRSACHPGWAVSCPLSRQLWVWMCIAHTHSHSANLHSRTIQNVTVWPACTAFQSNTAFNIRSWPLHTLFTTPGALPNIADFCISDHPEVLSFLADSCSPMPSCEGGVLIICESILLNLEI